MKERPILFSAPMVRALLAGTKTQTRRVVKPQFVANALPVEMPATDPAGGWVVPGHSGTWWCEAAANPDDVRRCPYGQPGDRLWVREAWGLHAYGDDTDWLKGSCTDLDLDDHVIAYRADWGPLQDSCHWRPSIHMPRAASRINLEVTGVRVERLQDISEKDAIAEGIEPFTDFQLAGHWRRYEKEALASYTSSPTTAYASLWESINGPESWAANPWVWAVSFRRVP